MKKEIKQPKNLDNRKRLNYPTYDSEKDIKKCLRCRKKECTNCLALKNGV